MKLDIIDDGSLMSMILGRNVYSNNSFQDFRPTSLNTT